MSRAKGTLKVSKLYQNHFTSSEGMPHLVCLQ